MGHRRETVARAGRRGRRATAAVVLTALVLCDLVAARPAGADQAADELHAHLGRSRYVELVHRTFLGRAPTPTEVEAGTATLQRGGDTSSARSQVVNRVALGEQWLAHVVTGLYRQALEREPDASGRAYWIGRLRAGALVNTVAASIYGSPEYLAANGGTVEAFVRSLYTRILGRSPSDPDVAYWSSAVGRIGRGHVAAGFFASVESRRTRVDELYRTLLCRAPDAGGASFWVGRLARENDVRLAVFLASSPEMVAVAQHGGCGSRTRVGSSMALPGPGFPAIDPFGHAPVVSGDGDTVVQPRVTNVRSTSRADVSVEVRRTGAPVRTVTIATGVVPGELQLYDLAVSDDGTTAVLVRDLGLDSRVPDIEIVLLDTVAATASRLALDVTSRHAYDPIVRLSGDGSTLAVSSCDLPSGRGCHADRYDLAAGEATSTTPLGALVAGYDTFDLRSGDGAGTGLTRSLASRDGRHLATCASDSTGRRAAGTYVIDTVAGSARRVSSDCGEGMVLSADGTTLAEAPLLWTGEGATVRTVATGAARRTLPSGCVVRTFAGPSSVAAECLQRQADPELYDGPSDLVALDIGSGARTVLVAGNGETASAADSSNDGRAIVFVGTSTGIAQGGVVPSPPPDPAAGILRWELRAHVLRR